MKNNKRVWTPGGYRVGPLNSLVGKGESIINYNDGTGTLVTKGTKGKDNQPSSVRPNDSNVIAGNDVDYIGYWHGKTTKPMSFADQIAPFTQQLERINSLSKDEKNFKLDSLTRSTKEAQEREINKVKQPLMQRMKEITDRQELQHKLESDPQYASLLANKGKDGIPKFEGGKRGSSENNVTNIPWYQRITPSVVGLGVGLSKLNRWGRTPITYHNTFAANPFGNRALSGLAGLRHNAYPEIKAMQDAERRGAYAINQDGNLTGSQRYLGRVGQNIANMQNAALAYSNAEDKNNAFKEKRYSALNAEGNAIATRAQNAYQHDRADYVGSHGHKTKGIEQSLYDVVNQVYSGYSNEYKYLTWRDAVRMYQQQLNNESQAALDNIQQRNADRAAQQAVADKQLEMQRQALQNNSQVPQYRFFNRYNIFNPAPISYDFNVGFRPIGEYRR